jgi:hypothetical protein
MHTYIHIIMPFHVIRWAHMAPVMYATKHTYIHTYIHTYTGPVMNATTHTYIHTYIHTFTKPYHYTIVDVRWAPTAPMIHYTTHIHIHIHTYKTNFFLTQLLMSDGHIRTRWSGQKREAGQSVVSTEGATGVDVRGRRV